MHFQRSMLESYLRHSPASMTPVSTAENSSGKLEQKYSFWFLAPD
jgi:hypothetical protein